jgi:hypothetical protein
MKPHFPCFIPRWISLMLLLLLPGLCRAQNLTPPGPVLKLTEKGGYVELPPDTFNDFTEATIEAWVKWNAFGNRYQRIFNYGGHNRDIGLTTLTGTNTLWFVVATPTGGLQTAKVENALQAGEWIHVAGVAGSGGMKLYVNGALVATNPYPGCFKALGTGNASRIGQTVTAGVDDSPFDGELAEVRVWKMARSAEQIRDNIANPLTGNEEGLAALWNFADPAQPGRDATPNGIHGKLIGQAKAVAVSDASSVVADVEERVLRLSGNGNYLELPSKPFQNLNEATFECWVKWQSFKTNEHVFEFDAAKRVKVGNKAGTADLEFTAAVPDSAAPAAAQSPRERPDASPTSIPSERTEPTPAPAQKSDTINQPGALRLNEWHHLATVFEPSGTRLYLDGVPVGTTAYTGGLGTVEGPDRHFLGACSLYPTNSFRGQFKEVRLWRTARSAEQIRDDLNKQLLGNENGLTALWNFADAANPGRDASPNHHDGKLIRSARVVAAAPPRAVRPPETPLALPGNQGVLDLDGNGSYVELPAEHF